MNAFWTTLAIGISSWVLLNVVYLAIMSDPALTKTCGNPPELVTETVITDHGSYVIYGPAQGSSLLCER